jgi:hypothetical protein
MEDERMGALFHRTTSVVGKEQDAREASCVLDIK